MLPTAIASATGAGTGVARFARKAPTAMAGHILGPNRSSAANEMPVGAHTGVALPCATDKDRPSFAETT